MKYKIWWRITDLGDGSSTTDLYATEAEAREGLDEEGFEIFEDYGYTADVPCEVGYTILDLTGCEQLED